MAGAGAWPLGVGEGAALGVPVSRCLQVALPI